MSTTNVQQRCIQGRNIKRLIRSDDWIRSSEWLPVPFSPSDEKGIGLFAVFPNEYNAVALQATVSSGQVLVDWGDGTTSTVNSNTTATKSYEYDALSNSTLTSLGYKQIIITITPTVPGALTSTNLSIKPSVITAQTSPAINWLEFKVGGPNYTVPALMGGFNNNGGSLGTNSYPLCENFEVLNGSLAGLNFTFNTSFQNLRRFKFVSRTNMSGSEQMNGTFSWCFNLTTVDIQTPSGKLQPGTLNSTFFNCYNLRNIPNIDYSLLSGMSTAFNDCRSLDSVGTVVLRNSTVDTSGGSPFLGMASLKSLEIISNSTSDFNASADGALTSVRVVLNNTGRVAFSAQSLINAVVEVNHSDSRINNMFTGCRQLQRVEFLGNGTITNAANAFQNCSSLRAIIGTINTSATCNFSTTFSGCNALQSVPSFNTNNLTNTFQNCYSLRSIGTINTGAGATTISGAFQGCWNLEVVPEVSSATVSATTFENLYNCKRINAAGMNSTNFTISQSKLDKASLDLFFENIGIPTTARTVTISNAQGAIQHPVITRSSTTTAGSTTVACSNTASFVNGMQVTGPGISDAVSVTFSDAADTVTRTAHGLPNGKRVSFTAITTTTGIAIFTPYYVVNATADTFQLSLTEGGAPINLVNNGTGTMIYQTLITAINPNVSVTIDVPASTSGTNNLNYRNINTQIAVMKRWAVTG